MLLSTLLEGRMPSSDKSITAGQTTPDESPQSESSDASAFSVAFTKVTTTDQPDSLPNSRTDGAVSLPQDIEFTESLLLADETKAGEPTLDIAISDAPVPQNRSGTNLAELSAIPQNKKHSAQTNFLFPQGDMAGPTSEITAAELSLKTPPLASALLTETPGGKPVQARTTTATSAFIHPESANEVKVPFPEMTGQIELSEKLAKTENIDLDLPTNPKGDVEKATLKQGNLPTIQSLQSTLGTSESLATKAPFIGQAISTPLAPAVQPTGQINLNAPIQLSQVPVADVTKHIIQATLKQESTLIQIDPPELGRLQLDFDHSNTGKTVITLSAETESLKMMLAERRHAMISLFQNHGLDGVEIQIDAELFRDDPSRDQQFFTAQDGSSNAGHLSNPEDQSQETQVVTDTEQISRTLSHAHPETYRLHIRV